MGIDIGCQSYLPSGAMSTLERCICRAAAHLSDAALAEEIAATERCAGTSTRTRRELALLRARCLRLELSRRAVASSVVLAAPTRQPIAR